MSDPRLTNELAAIMAPASEEIARLVEDIVERRTAPLVERIAGLEQRVADLERAAARPAASDPQPPR